MNALLALRHTVEGQAELSKLLARKYVRRGAFWLNCHAPTEWYRNCLKRGASRVRMSYQGEGILGVAFENCSRFTNYWGHTCEGQVLHHFGLSFFSREAYRLGLETSSNGFNPFARRPHIVITNRMLDRAWAELLESPSAEYLTLPTTMQLLGIKPRISWWQWLQNIFGIQQRI